MKKTSLYYPLRWVVMCKWPNNGFYEPIAAFNSKPVADQYARNCGANKPLQYRVQERSY